jgi:thiamine transport system substrate-binding protein
MGSARFRALVLASALLASAVAAGAADRKVLRVLTHDSFAVTKELVADFEAKNGATLQFITGGDAGETLNKAILAKGNPLADVIYGVDNTFAGRALASGILQSYASPLLARIPAGLGVDPGSRLLPVDYGFVCLNYDREWFARKGVPVPKTLEDLTKPAYRGLLVVENPATSSPGLAFLLATISRFGGGWEAWWKAVRANDALAVNGWNDAYYGEFSAAGKGHRPVVVSYATSPAAEVFFARDPKPSEPPTGSILAEGESFRQVEYVGILEGARNLPLARAFVDFMLSTPFQEDVPLQMFVYPASSQARLPDLFVRFAPVPPNTSAMDPAVIDARRDQWIRQWTQVFLK